MEQLESVGFGLQLSPHVMFSVHGIDFYILQSVTTLHEKCSVYRMEMQQRQTTVTLNVNAMRIVDVVNSLQWVAR